MVAEVVGIAVKAGKAVDCGIAGVEVCGAGVKDGGDVLSLRRGSRNVSFVFASIGFSSMTSTILVYASAGKEHVPAPEEVIRSGRQF